MDAGSRDLVPVLSDGVVTIRGYTAADAGDIVAYANDPQVQQWTTVPSPYTRRDAESFLAIGADAWRRGGDRSFAIETNGRWCGGLDIRPVTGHAAEVGYGLAPWARGAGVMRRALKLVLPWAFSTLDLKTVRWEAHVGNWASRRVAWASGFHITAALPAFLEHRGRRKDAWYGVLRRDDPLIPVNPWLDPVTITGPSVVLREHRDQDVPRMTQAASDQRTQYWLSSLPSPFTTDDAHGHLLRLRSDAANGRRVAWAVNSHRDDQMIGEVGIILHEPMGQQNEIGYWTHPDARGRGVMTEAVRLATRHALIPAQDGGLGLQRVFIRVAEGNAASRWVAVQAGFAPNGRDRAATVLRDGTVCDDIRYDLLAHELPAVR